MGLARPPDCFEPATSQKIAERIDSLLPRRPDPSRTGEGHARWSSCGVGASTREQDRLIATTRWAASPLHGRRWTGRETPLRLTCAGVQGESCLQSHSGPRSLPMPHAILLRFKLTGRPAPGHSDPEELRHDVLSFGEPHAATIPVPASPKS
jgi:hypothetical protein